MAERLRKSRFYMDSITDDIEGYTFGHRWNGWACPYLPRESVDEVIRGIGTFAEKYPELEYIGVSWNGDNLVLDDPAHPDEPEYVEPAIVTYEGEPLKVWPLGMYSWTWSESGDS